MRGTTIVHLLDKPVIWFARKLGLAGIYAWLVRKVRNTPWIVSPFYIFLPGIPALACIAATEQIPLWLDGVSNEFASGFLTVFLFSLFCLAALFLFVVGFQVAVLVSFGAGGMRPQAHWVEYEDWLLGELEPDNL